MSGRPRLAGRRRHPLAAIARRPSGPLRPARPGAPEGASAWGRREADPGATEPACSAGSLERAARTLGLLALTSAVGWLLTTDLVSGPLTIPLTSLDELRRWLDDSTPAILPAALLRLAALGLCAYLTLALVLTLAAQLVDRPTGGRALRAVGRLLPATLRRLVTSGAQCSLVAASAFPFAALPTAVASAEPPSSTATMAKLDPDEATDDVVPDAVPPAPAATATATATMTRLPASTPPTTVEELTTTIAPTTAPTSLAPVPPPPRAPAPAIPSETTDVADETWTVTPGDTFWSIAEEALTDRRGSFPPQHEIVRYWRLLITTNQSRLAAPGNPDLLLPGQSLVLPPPA